MKGLVTSSQLLVVFCMFVLVLGPAMAQTPVQDLGSGGSSDLAPDAIGIGLPPENESICDDEDEATDAILDCFVTKAATEDLDGPMPTATFWGTFCQDPVVSAGQTDGSLAPQLVLSAGDHFITIALESTDPMDQLFHIECPCETCECKVTIGAVGPVGPTGPAGADGEDGADGADGTDGEAGAVGATGPPGPLGPQGPTGSPGTDGADGATGPTGAAGSNGEDGTAGPTGPTGAAGADGEDGLNGMNGAPGATGPAGANGATGPTGPIDPDLPKVKEKICALCVLLEQELPEWCVCSYEGQEYDAGEIFPAGDDCNTCECLPDTTVACTDDVCVCTYGGQQYDVGEHWINESCNECECVEIGGDPVVVCGKGNDCICYVDDSDGGQSEYEPGDIFPAGDGCNTCECLPDATVVCSQDPCICTYDGQDYDPGDTFPAGDDCNTCECLPDTTVACTDDVCVCTYGGQQYDVGEHWINESCNECECVEIGGDPVVVCGKGNDCICYVDDSDGGQSEYEPGDIFPAGDGCNTCECLPDATVVCTQDSCGCTYNGQNYNPGDTFPHIDGCNTCVCNEDTTVTCTEIACS